MSTLSVVTRERLADTETAVSAYLKLCRGRSDSFLLESAETHETVGRYSIIAFDPLSALELWPETVRVTDSDGERTFPAERFFDLIRETLRTRACSTRPNLPAVGSLMGFLGYDAVRLIERLGPCPRGDLPVARLVFPSRFVVFDHRRRVMILVAIAENERAGLEKIAENEEMLRVTLEMGRPGDGLEVQEPDPERYMEAVRRAKGYIRAGDIFQVVLADRFTGRTGIEPIDVYRRLRVRSPSPYMFFLDFGGYQLLGASPETLVKVTGNRVVLRPIAGTRGRSDDQLRDQALEAELRASEKECAEHVMLVDLARNDAGRVSKYGTVTVSPYMTVDRFSHVMHLVSEVNGILRPEADAVQAFMAGFPAGTVSGAPKVRAMEIIDELEAGPRGPYAGAVGYFGPGLEMDTCIAIRMILFEKDRFTIPVGAGIVADSLPEMEYKEIQNKAAQSIAALRSTARGEL
ncbi:MAG: anthranilate synthase component I family protein [Proteobacteria bacterium]|nr:anthranilate synthase component I family protein [Pseudomonadota bacterium]